MKPVIARLVGAAIVLTPLLAQAGVEPVSASTSGAIKSKKPKVVSATGGHEENFASNVKSSPNKDGVAADRVKPVPVVRLPRGVSPIVATHNPVGNETTTQHATLHTGGLEKAETVKPTDNVNANGSNAPVLKP